MVQRSTDDESFIRAIAETNPHDEEVVIFSARPSTFDKEGKYGLEMGERYKRTRVIYYNLANGQRIQEQFEAACSF